MERAGCQAHDVTTASRAGAWSHYTGEQEVTQQRLLAAGVTIHVCQMLVGVTADSVELACVYSGPIISLPSSALAFVTAREPDAALYRALVGEDPPEQSRIQAIGDCDQPAFIAHAVYSGHRAGPGCWVRSD